MASRWHRAGGLALVAVTLGCGVAGRPVDDTESDSTQSEGQADQSAPSSAATPPAGSGPEIILVEATPPTDAAKAQMPALLLATLAQARARANLPPTAPDPILAQVAALRARELAATGPTSASVTATTDRLHRLGYRPHHWREATVCCDLAPELLDPGAIQLGDAMVHGEWDHAAAACAPGPDGELCVLLVAKPVIARERLQVAPLADREAVRREVLEAVNTLRTEASRAPLVADSTLDAVAQSHAEDMLQRRYYDHTNPQGQGPRQRLEVAGWPIRIVAENIAKGLFSPTEVVERWEASSDHRRNLLLREVERHGLGVAVGEVDGRVEVLWCELLATPL